MVDTRVGAVCSRLVAGIRISNPAEGMFIRVLCLLFVGWQRPLPGADLLFTKAPEWNYSLAWNMEI
jgi:hypothetical protein